MCIDVHTPVRIAVIGCGNFGQHHARCLAASPEFELVGVCDRVIERAEALAHVHGVDCAEHISGLTRTPEAVCVVVPPEGHGELVDDCMSRGLHVLVEKPFGVDPMVVAALNEKAGASGRILHVGYLERYHDAVNLAAARVKRPTHIRCVRIAPHDAGRFAACDTLHVVLDLMSHDIDHVLRLVGSDPISVTTLAPSASRPPAELTSAVLRFQNGATAVLTAGRLGTERRRKIDLFDGRHWASADLIDGAMWWQGKLAYQANCNPLSRQLTGFAKNVRGLGDVESHAGDAGRVLTIALEIMSQEAGSQIVNDDLGADVPASRLDAA